VSLTVESVSASLFLHLTGGEQVFDLWPDDVGSRLMNLVAQSSLESMRADIPPFLPILPILSILSTS
jgi:hypothetical protein